MKRSKGLELPMNTLVVIAIAVIILLAMTAFFIGVFTPSSQSQELQQNFNNACANWARLGYDDDYATNKYVIDEVFRAYVKLYNNNLGCGTDTDEALAQGLDACADEDTKKNAIQTLKAACGYWK